MSAGAPVSDAQAGQQTLIPPEATFWIRYSPHHEAPLSGVASTILHVLAIVAILLIVMVQNILKVEDESRSLPVEPIRFMSGGGGGKVGGSGSGPGGTGDIGDERGVDEQGSIDEGDVNQKPLPPTQAPLEPARAPVVKEEFKNDNSVEKLLARSTEQFGALTKLEGEARSKIRKAVNPGTGSGQGQGGSGSGGGRDKGKDKGQGGGTGAGSGELNQREKRVLRWAMTFNTRDGRDYMAQLTGLGAMVAIPIDEKAGRFLLIRDLKNPAAAREEDLTNLDRIYWIDDKPDSVASLFAVLPHRRPAYFVAFFPKELESKLLRLELNHTERKYRTRDEDKIHETKYDVVNTPEGYDVRVREVYLRR